MVSGTCAMLSRLYLKLKGEKGSGLEGVDYLCFHTYGQFSPSPSPPSPPQVQVLRPKSKSSGPNPSLEAQIPLLRTKS